MDEQSRVNLVKKKSLEYEKYLSDYDAKHAELERRRQALSLHDDLIPLELECEELLGKASSVNLELKHFSTMEDYNNIPEYKNLIDSNK